MCADVLPCAPLGADPIYRLLSDAVSRATTPARRDLARWARADRAEELGYPEQAAADRAGRPFPYSLYRAYRWFRAHHGCLTSAAAAALSLARAERWLVDEVAAGRAAVEWVWDENGWDADDDSPAPAEVLGCVVRTVDDHRSIWGIGDPDDDYRRLVEAELASELMPDPAAGRPGAAPPAPIGPADLDGFARAYVECALWASTGDDGEPLDAVRTIDDVAPATLAEMATDCKDFVAGLCQATFDAITETGGWGRAGADFWLTRNRHGAGFWDGDWPDGVGARLTALAHAYGDYDLYVGDDGLIHGA